MEHGEVERLLEAVERIAQCPICLDTVKAPVAQCLNGHIYCGTCKEVLTECSVCRGPFIETINRFVEELLNTLPKPCPYNDKGCKLFTCSDTHAQFCEYRPISCKVGEDQSCTWIGSVNEWEAHVDSTHNSFKASYSYNNFTDLKFIDFRRNSRSLGYHHKVDEEEFLFYTWKSGKEFCLTIKHVLCKKPEKEFYFKVTFQSDEEVLYQSLIKSANLMENESVEHNPTIFLLEELYDVSDENNNLEVWVKPFSL